LEETEQIFKNRTGIDAPKHKGKRVVCPALRFFIRPRSLAIGCSGRFRWLAIYCRWLAKSKNSTLCPMTARGVLGAVIPAVSN
jgi:hypothetical protein